jgi:nicotinamidase-related amidase
MQDNNAALRIDPARTALLLLHWQNDVVSSDNKRTGKKPERIAAAHNIEHTQAVLKASRENGVLVIYVNTSMRATFPELSPAAAAAPISRNVVVDKAHLRGSKDVQVIDQLKPLENEIMILNFNPSAFSYTELDLILRNKGITHLVLSGVSTNWVVETTARDGACMGYFIYTLEDCCNSTSDEMHNWPITNVLPKLGAVINSETYIAALQKSV